MRAATKRESRPRVSGPETAQRFHEEPQNNAPAPPKAGSAPAPWFRFHPADFMLRTCRLGALERGVFVSLLAQMHEAGAPIAEDHKRLARACGLTRQTSFAAALASLAAEGLIVSRHGELWAPMMQAEIDFRAERSVSAQQKSRVRWEKARKNNGRPMLVHTQSQSPESEGGVPPGPPPDSRARSTFDSRRDARSSSASPTSRRHRIYRAEEEIEVSGFGICHVCEVMGGDRYWVRVVDDPDLAFCAFVERSGTVVRWKGEDFDDTIP